MSNPPHFLLLDTSDAATSVALSAGDRIVAKDCRAVTTHGESLMHVIVDLLQSANHSLHDLDGIVCGLGPGSFTGIRIGVATAKGLAYAANKALLGMPSTDAIAAHLRAKTSWTGEIGVLLDARRGQVYGCIYPDVARVGDVDSRAEVLGCLTGDEMVSCLRERGQKSREPIVFVGNGTITHPEFARLGAAEPLSGADNARMFDARIFDQIDVSYLVPAALGRWSRNDIDDVATLEPLYYRPPDIRRS